MKEILQSSSISIIKGIIISCIITLILLFIYSALLTYTKIEENTMNVAVILITTVSILAGSSVRCRKNKEKWTSKSEE